MPLRVAEQAFRSDTGRQRTANEDSLYARAPLFAHMTRLLDAQAPSRVMPIADDVYVYAPKVAGFRPHPYLSLPYMLLDVAGAK